jgi:hypothetical protein
VTDRARERVSPGVLAALLIATALVIVPAFLEARSRIESAWSPLGDDAMVAWLSYDVLSTDTPSLGMPATLTPADAAQGERAETLSHPGPMLFWLFALPERLSGGSPAVIALTVYLIQVASIISLVWVIRKRARPTGVFIALLAVAACELALGREVFGEPLNPLIVLLPFATFLGASWVAALGDDDALPFMAFFGSLAALSHFVFVPVVGVVAIATAVMYARRRERGTRPSLSERLGAGIVIVCWLPVLFDTLVEFPGNLVRSLQSGAEQSGPSIGFVNALEMLFHLLGQVGLWRSAVHGHRIDVYNAISVIEIVIIVVGIALIVLAARRDERVRTLAVITLVAAIGLTWTVNRLPNPPYNFLLAPGGPAARDRLIYVVGALYLALLVASVCVLASGLFVGRRTSALWAAAGVGIVAVLALPAGVRHAPLETGLAGFRDPVATETVRDLAAGRAQLDRNRPYLMRGDFFSTFTVERALMWDLYRRGYRIRAADGDLFLRHDETEPGPVDRLLVADGSVVPAPDWRVIAMSDARRKRLEADAPIQRSDIMRDQRADWLALLDAHKNDRFNTGTVERRAPALARYFLCQPVLGLILEQKLSPDDPFAFRLCMYVISQQQLATATVYLYLDPAGP